MSKYLDTIYVHSILNIVLNTVDCCASCSKEQLREGGLQEMLHPHSKNSVWKYNESLSQGIDLKTMYLSKAVAVPQQ